MKIKTIAEWSHDENCYMPLYRVKSKPLIQHTFKRRIKMNTLLSVRFYNAMQEYEKTGFIGTIDVSGISDKTLHAPLPEGIYHFGWMHDLTYEDAVLNAYPEERPYMHERAYRAYCYAHESDLYRDFHDIMAPPIYCDIAGKECAYENQCRICGIYQRYQEYCEEATREW